VPSGEQFARHRQGGNDMTRTMLAAAGACAVAATVTLAAQTPTTPPTTTQPPTATQQRDTKDAITVTGCLKTWDDAMKGSTTGARTPGTTATSPGTAARYVLTNAEEGMGKTSSSSTSPSTSPSTSGTPSTSTPSTSGTSGSSRASDDDKKYIVTAESGVSLSQHVNHQVRITGKKTEASSSRSTTSSTPSTQPSRPGEPSTTSRGSMSGDDMNLDTIVASSVTMVSATCPAGTQ
jgi:hypothetical protein